MPHSERESQQDPFALPAFGFDRAEDAWLNLLREAERGAPSGDFGVYRHVTEIGRGGQAVVYRAWDSRRERHVALKRLIAGAFASAGARARLARELEAARTLAHDAIVGVHEIEWVDSQPVLVMQWIDGQPITAWARARTRTRAEIVSVFVTICTALEHAHERGVVHRDLKPANILIDAHGRPHLVDFGLARVRAATPTAQPLTQVEEFVGTLPYAAPEQLRGDRVDARTDLYAVGVVLCEVLTGKRPLPDAHGPIARLRLIEQTSPELRATGALQPILQTLLASDPAERYASATALRQELERVASGRPARTARTAAAWRLARRLAKRHPYLTSALAMGLATVLMLALFLGVSRQRALQAAERARAAQTFFTDLLFAASAQQQGADVALLDLLGQASREAPARLQDQPRFLAAVERRIAETYASLWLWQRVEEPIHLALRAGRDAFGARGLETAECLDLLGLAQARMHDPRALGNLEQALAIFAQQLGDDDARTMRAATHRVLAIACAGRDHERATPLLRSIIARLGDRHSAASGDAHHALALIEIDAGNRAAANADLEAALSHYRAAAQPLPPAGIECLNLLALLRQGRGDLGSAAEALLESLSIMPAAFGESWRPLLTWRLGRVRELERNWDLARDLFHRALAMWVELLARRAPAQADRARELLLLARMAPRKGSPHREILAWIEREGLADRRHVRAAACQLAELCAHDGDWPAVLDLARMSLDGDAADLIDGVGSEAADLARTSLSAMLIGGW